MPVIFLGNSSPENAIFDIDAYPWATEFDEYIKSNINSGDTEALINYTEHSSLRLAHPIND